MIHAFDYSKFLALRALLRTMSRFNRFVDWIYRFFFNRGLITALVAPVVLFVLLDLAGQLILRAVPAGIIGHADSYTYFESSALIIPLLAFLLAFLLSILAVGSQFVKTGWWRLLDLQRSMADIRSLPWVEFERLVAAAFERRGYEAELVGRDGPDGGIDVILRKPGDLVFVQCKHYRHESIGERPLREFLGVVTARKANKGIFVTSGVFSDSARVFADTAGRLELIEGPGLLAMVQEVQRTETPQAKCPKCGSPMSRKNGKNGPFRSCVRWPACRGSLSLPTAA